ncbi:VWA domain-containing protein [Rhodococcus aetherivorans]|uniref:VWA domain-containing protein n=1 Tax=Rhodococcus TaxID=1827 RepID=UPI000927A549|nr:MULTISPECIES: VWA domain-containing protein [Rhodococcus]MBC2589406.1 VWA domain-containing protein [Rhodococcus aetherivorans]OLL19068.1 stress protein [Rhodococcus sp. M8]QPG47758.1 VWA domain-containing protein [Rhodococcus sp. M8]UGQ42131.1 VWA domain-containing protein [Rhodococcus aetherivorans]
MAELARGENTTIPSGPVTVAVAGARQGTVDLMVFQLGADQRVRSDADFVFFNQPASPEGAVRLVAADRIGVDLAAIPAGIERLSVAVALDDSVPGSLSAVPGLGVQVAHPAGETTAPALGLSTERAAVLLEIYRRNGAWKLRNVSAGWDTGLSALVVHHGVQVDDQPASAEPAAVAPPPAVVDSAGVRTVAGEAKLSLEKRQRLDLRKREVAKVLLDKGAAGVRARVVLVIDKTGSMHREYTSARIHQVVERMVPIAVQVDDDGTLEPYLYAVSFARLPDIAVHDVESWCATYLHLGGVHGGIDYEQIGGYNDELPVMGEIISTLTAGASMPTLVLFFTDGGFHKKGPITALMKKASGLPAFWQFVGLGKANYGVLEKLDTMRGRVVDNAGFFSVDDISQVSDAELYRRLLGEFPDWLRAARAARIVG